MEFYGNPQEKLKILAFTGTKGRQQLLTLLTTSYLNATQQLSCQL